MESFHPWTKNLFKILFCAFKNHKCIGCVDRQQTYGTHFQAVMTTVNKDYKDINKTKVPDEFIFHSVLLVCFTAELEE